MGLMNDPICERRLEADESATHVLCDCEALAYLRFRHLGQFFIHTYIHTYIVSPVHSVLFIPCRFVQISNPKFINHKNLIPRGA
jgi:hypothetical protein